MRLVAFVLAVVALWASPVLAQMPPNDTDLKAAFCMGVLSRMISGAGAPNPIANPSANRRLEEGITKTRAAQQRTQAYLLPRTQFIDQGSVLYAMTEGIQTVSQSALRLTQCESDPAAISTIEAFTKCLGSSYERIQGCLNPTYLPF